MVLQGPNEDDILEVKFLVCQPTKMFLFANTSVFTLTHSAVLSYFYVKKVMFYHTFVRNFKSSQIMLYL